MFENEKDEEYWLGLAKEHGESLGVDTREGSVYMDMQAGHCFRIAKFYNDLDRVFEMMAIDTCSGDILKEKAAQDDIHFYKASPSYWTADFIGALPEEGTEFLCGDYYLTWKEVHDEVLNGFYLVSNDLGTVTNTLISGTELVPMDNIDDLEVATLGHLVTEGTDEENDEHLRNRWRNQKVNRTANGNIMHYKSWCEDIQGVGRAIIFPLFAGENTVKAVLFSSDGMSVSEELVQKVQEYVDPIDMGYEVTLDGKKYICGDGMGMGVANLGAHFLAVSANPFELRITVPVTLSEGYTKDTAEEKAESKIREYLKKLALETTADSKTIVRISTIGSMIADMPDILDYDYSELKINGYSENIIIEVDSVAVLSEVVFVVES